jgi:hypothetical protein
MMKNLVKHYNSSNIKHNNSCPTSDKEKIKKTTKTIWTLYNIPLLDDTSNKKSKKNIDNKTNNHKEKFNTLSFKKGNCAYPQIHVYLLRLSMNPKMVLIMKHFLVD